MKITQQDLLFRWLTHLSITWLKFLDSIIKPYIPDEYMLKSTDDFMNKLKEFRGDQNQVMVSFDVVSLFTNVPLKETINIIVEYIFSDSTNDSQRTFL